MPRIPQPDLDRIKQGVPLVDLAAERGVALSGQGTNLIGRCPFHDDRTPSLVIDPVQNLWHCLGACQQGGDAIRWVEVAEGVGFVEAVARLRARLDGVPAAPAAAPAAPRSPAAPTAPTADATDLLRRVVLEHYPSRLVPGSPGAVYLEGANHGQAQIDPL